VAASRVHRWTRGDWQLLPFLLQPGRWRLHAINRWKLLDNLRRSLVAPMALALLLPALAGVGLAPGVAVALVLAAFAAGPLMGAAAGFMPGRSNRARRHFYHRALTELVRALCGGVWHLVQLPLQGSTGAFRYRFVWPASATKTSIRRCRWRRSGWSKALRPIWCAGRDRRPIDRSASAPESAESGSATSRSKPTRAAA
jgi:hypothetical protein